MYVRGTSNTMAVVGVQDWAIIVANNSALTEISRDMRYYQLRSITKSTAVIFQLHLIHTETYGTVKDEERI